MKNRLTKTYIQNHFRYHAFVYILIGVASFAGMSLAFSVTKYVPPPEKQIVVYFMDDYFSQSEDSTINADAAEEFPDMELIEFLNTPMTTYEGQQKFMVTLAANEGDIYVIDRMYFSTFVNDMLTEPLDAYVDGGIIDISGISETLISAYSAKAPAEAEYAQPGDDTLYLYAIPADDLYGMMAEFLVDNRNKMLVIPSYSGNKENAAKMVAWLYERFYYEEEPAFVDNYDRLIQQLQENDSLAF